MKVYLVESRWIDGDKEIEGVYSTRAGADEVVREVRAAYSLTGFGPWAIDIIEIELDDEPARLLEAAQ